MKYDRGVKKEEVVVLEILQQEFEQMLENDYRYRLASAIEGEAVERRTVQEIFNEFNSRELSSWRKHNRRLIPTKVNDGELREMELTDLIVDNSQAKFFQEQENYEAQCQWIRQHLKPEQAEMVIAIYLDGMRVKDYAKKISNTPKQVTDRLSYAKKLLREVLSKI